MIAISVATIGLASCSTPESQWNVQEEADNLNLARAAIANLYSSAESTNGLSPWSLQIAKALPLSWTVSGEGADIKTETGNVIKINVTKIDKPNDGFAVSYPNVPRTICESFVASVSGGFDFVEIDGNKVETSPVSGKFDNEQLKVSCDAQNQTSSLVEVSFVKKLW